MDNRTDPGLPRPVSDSKPEPPVPPHATPDEPIPSEFGVEEPGLQEPEEPETQDSEPNPDAEAAADNDSNASETEPPVMPSEPLPPTAEQPAPPDVPPKSGCPWVWMLACGLGCGALIIGIMVALLVIGYFATESDELRPEPSTTIESDTSPADAEYERQPGDDGEAETVPEMYQPGEQVALEAALVDYPDWIAKVQSNSSDWTEAVIWIGPPQSEFVWEYKLRWNAEGNHYDVLSVDPVEPVD